MSNKKGKEVINPLITRDPVRGKELIVTRLESPGTGVVIEGKFSLGWIGRLTYEQLEFVGLLVKNRGNIQKLASEMNIAYNTARNHLDEIVAALDGKSEVSAPAPSIQSAQRELLPSRVEIMQQLVDGAITFDEAMKLLK